MKRKDVLVLTALGLISGFASSSKYFYFLSYFFKELGGFEPGIFFGFVIFLFFFFFGQLNHWWKGLIFIVISGIAYFSAVQVAISCNECIQLNGLNLGGVVYGGMVGAFILLLGFNFLMSSLGIKNIILLTLLGGILGLISALIHPPQFFKFSDNKLALLFLIWQTGMALALGVVLNRKYKTGAA